MPYPQHSTVSKVQRYKKLDNLQFESSYGGTTPSNAVSIRAGDTTCRTTTNARTAHAICTARMRIDRQTDHLSKRVHNQPSLPTSSTTHHGTTRNAPTHPPSPLTSPPPPPHALPARLFPQPARAARHLQRAHRRRYRDLPGVRGVQLRARCVGMRGAGARTPALAAAAAGARRRRGRRHCTERGRERPVAADRSVPGGCGRGVRREARYRRGCRRVRALWRSVRHMRRMFRRRSFTRVPCVRACCTPWLPSTLACQMLGG